MRPNKAAFHYWEVLGGGIHTLKPKHKLCYPQHAHSHGILLLLVIISCHHIIVKLSLGQTRSCPLPLGVEAYDRSLGVATPFTCPSVSSLHTFLKSTLENICSNCSCTCEHSPVWSLLLLILLLKISVEIVSLAAARVDMALHSPPPMGSTFHLYFL